MGTRPSALGENLRYIRHEVRGMTRAQLDVASGVSIGSITKIEQGIQDPSATALGKLAAALDVSADQLLGLASLPEAPKPATPARRRFRERAAQRSRSRKAGNGCFPQPASDLRKVA